MVKAPAWTLPEGIYSVFLNNQIVEVIVKHSKWQPVTLVKRVGDPFGNILYRIPEFDDFQYLEIEAVI